MRCGKSESEVGALVHLPPNMDICPSCLETEVNQMSQMFGFTVPGQPSQGSSQPSPDSGAQGGEIEEVTEDPEIAEIEVKMVPYNPEEAYSVLIKAKRADGTCKKAVLDNMYATVPSVEYYMTDAEEIIDYRTGSRQYDV